MSLMMQRYLSLKRYRQVEEQEHVESVWAAPAPAMTAFGVPTQYPMLAAYAAFIRITTSD